MGLIRNQVYGSPVPWVRIPPSPPENEKAPLWGLFVFSPRGYGLSNPVRRKQRRRRNSILPSPRKQQDAVGILLFQCFFTPVG